MLSINEMLVIANQMHASDLHLSVGVPPKVRVFGDLVDIEGCAVLTPADTAELGYSIIPPQLVQRFEEQGELDFSYAIMGEGRYRANVFHQRGSIAAVLRLIGMDIPSPSQLGIPNAVVDLTFKKRGLVLVTGPTGSGKSTTLASLINVINDRSPYHVITLEDPIEYLHPHKRCIVNQREIGLDTKSFSQALTSALREDPDVILVGEMRDLDTIATAITAAETGHLVFSTLHTIGAAATIDRIIDVFPPYQQTQIRSQLAMVLEGVISQALCPVIGGNGRKAAFEVMLATPAIRNLIRENKTFQIAGTMQTSRKMGMKTLDDDLYDLYNAHFIDRETAISFAQDAGTLGQRLSF